MSDETKLACTSKTTIKAGEGCAARMQVGLLVEEGPKYILS